MRERPIPGVKQKKKKEEEKKKDVRFLRGHTKLTFFST